MALDQTEKDALEHLAKEFDTVASWHGGARENHIRLLAGRLRSVGEGKYAEWFGDAKAQAEALSQAEAQLAAERAADEKAQAAAEAARQQAQEQAQKATQDQ